MKPTSSPCLRLPFIAQFNQYNGSLQKMIQKSIWTCGVFSFTLEIDKREKHTLVRKLTPCIDFYDVPIKVSERLISYTWKHVN